MANKRGLSEFRSCYGYTHEDEDVSDHEEWQSTRPSNSNSSRQSTILPASKKRRIDSPLSNPGVSKPSLRPDPSCRHSRIIIHVDIDCFYAQVEMLQNPELRNLPLGIQQKHIVVTCNYIARKCGVTKLSYVSDAKKKCPDLVLVNGEDLTVYREFSRKVHSLLTREFTPLVERLGMDENYLDVTELVNTRLECNHSESRNFSGAVYSRSLDSHQVKSSSPCLCGCHERLRLGSKIAAEVRQAILAETGLTCCAGISYNKLLAKLVGGWKKPNMQTTLLPEDAENLLLGLQARDIPGIGHSTAKKLRMINVLSVADVLSCPSQILEREFGSLQATLMTRLCHGIDDSAVTPSGEFKSITDEDSFKKCSTLEDARKRLVHLIEGLLPRVSSDTGVPETVRVTVRRQGDHSNKRESRQCRLPHSFSFDNKEKARNTLLTDCLVLFNKLVDVKKPFHLTLLGVSLANFHKLSTTQSKNISSFFQKSFSEERDSALFVDRLTATNSAKTYMHKSPENSYITGTSEDRDQKAQEGSDMNTQGTQEKETSMMVKNQPAVCPKGVDPTVFAELPLDLQREIEAQWQQDTRMPIKNIVKTDKVTPKAKKCVGIQRYFAKEQGSPASVTFK